MNTFFIFIFIYFIYLLYFYLTIISLIRQNSRNKIHNMKYEEIKTCFPGHGLCHSGRDKVWEGESFPPPPPHSPLPLPLSPLPHPPSHYPLPCPPSPPTPAIFCSSSSSFPSLPFSSFSSTPTLLPSSPPQYPLPLIEEKILCVIFFLLQSYTLNVVSDKCY